MGKRKHHESATSAAPTTLAANPTDEPTAKRSKTAEPSEEGGPSPLGAPPQIPPNVFTAWTLSKITTTYPPLPEVLDPRLETAALTHRGRCSKPSDVSYEQLEWLGDIYLELIASELIAATFPMLDPGRASQYREMLVRNTTLGQFTLHYGLHKRANFPTEFDLGGRPNGTSASAKERIKVLGDLFEAYVGAIVRSDPVNGIRRVTEWMKVLWAPLLEKQILEAAKKGKNTMDMQILPKTQLEQQIVVPGVRIEYRELPSNGKKDRDTNQPLFMMGCFLHGWGEEGLQLGYGQALSKKEAGQRAAARALENKKLIKKFADKKQAFMAAKAAGQGQQQQQSVTALTEVQGQE
jgi:ribonuclease-3